MVTLYTIHLQNVTSVVYINYTPHGTQRKIKRLRWLVGLLEFNVPFQRKYGYITDDECLAVTSPVWHTEHEAHRQHVALEQVRCRESAGLGPCSRQHPARWAEPCWPADDTSGTKTLCVRRQDPVLPGPTTTTSANRKPSVEVALTTLATLLADHKFLLLIYSFQVRSAFQPRQLSHSQWLLSSSFPHVTLNFDL